MLTQLDRKRMQTNQREKVLSFSFQPSTNKFGREINIMCVSADNVFSRKVPQDVVVKVNMVLNVHRNHKAYWRRALWCK